MLAEEYKLIEISFIKITKCKFETMKSSILYYLVIAVPFVTLLYFGGLHKIDSVLFTVLLPTYVFIYRSITDYLRLLSRNIIGRRDFWRAYMPSSESNTLKHFISSDIAVEQTFIKQGWTLESLQSTLWLCKNHGIAQHHHADD